MTDSQSAAGTGAKQPNDATVQTPPQPASRELVPGLLTEVEVMYKYARKNGYDIPPDTITRCCLLAYEGTGFTEAQIAELAVIHQQLNRIIAPATPQAVLLMEADLQRHALLTFLGAVPLVRNLMLLTAFFLVLFVAVGQLSIVNETNLVRGILESSGWEVVAVIAYLVSCAGLGASFAALFKLNSFISNATYDPRYDSTYWASILLGVIAGLFISELLYSTLFGSGVALSLDGVAPANGEQNSNADLGKPFLALIGGFSANMVYKVMQRLVDTIESLFKGDPAMQSQAQQQVQQANLQQQQGEMKMELANRLLPLTNTLTEDPDKAKSDIQGLIDQLLTK